MCFQRVIVTEYLIFECFKIKHLPNTPLYETKVVYPFNRAYTKECIKNLMITILNLYEYIFLKIMIHIWYTIKAIDAFLFSVEMYI